jgi:hypothetical protein
VLFEEISRGGVVVVSTIEGWRELRKPSLHVGSFEWVVDKRENSSCDQVSVIKVGR